MVSCKNFPETDVRSLLDLGPLQRTSMGGVEYSRYLSYPCFAAKAKSIRRVVIIQQRYQSGSGGPHDRGAVYSSAKDFNAHSRS